MRGGDPGFPPCGFAAIMVAVSLGSCQSSDKESKPPAESQSPPNAARPAPKIREAAVAGSWYPDDPAVLGAQLDRMLAGAEVPESSEGSGPGGIRALVVPHAGYRYSGPTAAVAYKTVAGQPVRRVVVLGPAHLGRFTGLSIADATHYRTPLGDIPLDVAEIAGLRRDPMVVADPRAHRHEHSIEMQLPLLQRTLPGGFELIPILVGGFADVDGYRRAAELIRPLLDDHTLLVASGDFTHYGDNYGYVPFPRGADIATRLRQLDMGALELVNAGDAAGLHGYRGRTGLNACAFGPLMLLAHLLDESTRATLVAYQTSGALTGDYANSVSYLSVVYSDREPLGRGRLGLGDMVLLHRLASRTLERAVTHGADSPGSLPAGSTLPERLRQKSGAFVTLEKDGRLRGCIGHIWAQKPLHEAVIDNAVNAALHDRRFRPVTADELAGLEVEVSVLSPLETIASVEEFEVGVHGIVLYKGGARAVYLPEVAPEQGWDREQTLAHLARKAGLPADGWREGAAFSVFTSQKYSAPWRPE